MPAQDSLEHYGVLGMKWGVRKNPDNAISKANRKLNRLDKKANKKEAKADRRSEKALGRNERAELGSPLNVIRRGYAGFTSSSTIRTISRAQEKRAKAKRWSNKMVKGLGESNARKTALGQKYVDMTLKDIQKSNKTIDELDGYIRRFNNRYSYFRTNPYLNSRK